MALTELAAPPLLTPGEAARRLALDQVSTNPAQAVRRMAQRGLLTGRRVGRWTMITAESVDAYIRGD